MDIRVLGPIEVHDGHQLAIGGPRQRRILAALALHANAVVSIDRLVDITWPDGEVSDQAEPNLRSYVYRIRTGLGEDLAERIVTSPPGYLLRVDDGEVDAGRFERLVEQADREAAQGDPGSALAHVDEALELWQGGPYEEFAGEEWVIAEESRLGELRARALERRCESLVQLGRADDAITALESLIDQHPLREHPRGLLMTALYGAGRQAEALRRFAEFRELLVEEMGIDPSEELADLERRILQQDPALHDIAHGGRALRSYQLDEVMGEGAFAVVWRGRQPELGREVAVKQVRAELANDPEFVRRFDMEAQLISTLEHPHIVPLYDYWREPDAAFLVMRLLRGGTLEQRLAAGPLDETELLRLVQHIGAAIRLAHRAGVVHRDVRAGNVMLDEDSNFYLTDFGIALGPGAGPDDFDGSRDVHDFGDMLGEAAAAAARGAGTQVPTWLDRLVTRATARPREDRYRDIEELLADVPDLAGRMEPIVDVPWRNPFKGLRAFGEVDVADFHGRDRLVERLLEVLRRPGTPGRLVAAVGPSGSGKSSVVRAGLVPALRNGAVPGSDRWFVATMVPGPRPFEELESALAAVAAAPPGRLVDTMRSDDRGIAEALDRILPDASSQLLLVVDQFEELFTLTDSEDDRQQFLDGLLTAIDQPRSRLRVALTIRADFWDRPLAHGGLAPLLETAAVTVSPLDADEIEAAVVEPVAAQGIDYEPGLVARIVADVADQPGALPLMQFALTELYDRTEQARIPALAYDQIGGITGALAQRAEDTYLGFDEDHQRATRVVCGRLVSLGEGSEDTRRRVTISELASVLHGSEVIDALGSARLLTFDRDLATRLPTVEIAHEALLRAWPRLARWIDEDRDDLRVRRRVTLAAGDWERTRRDPDELYRGARLESALELADRSPESLNELEAAFLQTSAAAEEAAQQRARRRTRILKSLLAVAAVLLVVAVIATAVAVDRADEAATERDAAQAAQAALELDLLTSRAAAADAGGPPVVASLVAAELARRSPSSQALDFVAETLLDEPDWIGSLPGYWVTAAPRGSELITVEDARIVVRDRADLTSVREIPIRPFAAGATGRRFMPAISPDGRRLAIDEPAGLRIVDLETGVFGPVIDLDMQPTFRGLAWTSDGAAIVAAVDSTEMEVLDVDGLDAASSHRVPLDLELTSPWLVADPTGPQMAVSSAGTVLLFDTSAIEDRLVETNRYELGGTTATTLSARFDLGVRTLALSNAAWSDDGVLYVSILGGDVFVIDQGGPEPLEGLPPSTGRLVVSPLTDGRVFVGDDAGTGAVVNLDTERVVEGPWPSPSRLGYTRAIEALAGDVVAMLATDGNNSEIHLWSRVAGNLLGRTLPPFEIRSGAPALYYPRSEVINVPNVGGVIEPLRRITDEGVEVVDLGLRVGSGFEGFVEDIDPADEDPFLWGASVSPTDAGDLAVAFDSRGRTSFRELPSGEPFAAPIEIVSDVESVFGLRGGFVTRDRETLLVATERGFLAYGLADGRLLGSFDHGLAHSLDANSSSNRAASVGSNTDGLDQATEIRSVVVDVDELDELGVLDGAVGGFSADGGEAVVTTLDGRLSVVDIESGDPVWSVPVEGQVLGALSPDDDYVIAWGQRVQFYDRDSAQPVGPQVPGVAVFDVGVLTQVREGRVHVWNTDPNTWPDIACEAAGRNLTREEWETYLPDGLAYEPSCSQWPVEG